jgi:hypothetical protein
MAAVALFTRKSTSGYSAVHVSTTGRIELSATGDPFGDVRVVAEQEVGGSGKYEVIPGSELHASNRSSIFDCVAGTSIRDGTFKGSESK